MQSVNPDLLRAFARHHPDGRPKDPHAHHGQDHRARLRAARRLRLRAWLARLVHRPPRATRPASDACL